jgi:hypothetical protein
MNLSSNRLDSSELSMIESRRAFSDGIQATFQRLDPSELSNQKASKLAKIYLHDKTLLPKAESFSNYPNFFNSVFRFIFLCATSNSMPNFLPSFSQPSTMQIHLNSTKTHVAKT